MGWSSVLLGAAALVQSLVAPSEALVDRFVAALPDVAAAGEIDRTPDAAELDRLSRLNPGLAAEVRRVLEDKAACVSASENASSIATMRRAAHALGTPRLERMIAFYEGGDFRVFSDLTDRAERGETLSAEELAQLEKINSAYPLAAMAEAFRVQRAAIPNDQVFIQAVRNCVSQADAALSRQRLRTK